MRLQLGLLHTDGKPATADDMALLLGAADGMAEISGEIIDGSLVMAYRGDRITWEEEVEIQPLSRGMNILTWDGRLDNREELAGRLGLGHLHDVPDPEIVLQLYAAFGQSIFKDIIGEFAMTLWSKDRQKLLFVRSTCGARPLYYTQVNGTLFWASDFAHLVRVSGVDLGLNETYFLEYLLMQPSTALSPLANVNAVPANGLLLVESDRVKQVDELWNATHTEALRYRTDQQYEEHLREALTEAVRVRLRARSPVFAELSGGLDSSSIVLTADQVLKSNNQAVEDLRTLSGVYEESQTCDEQKFICLVEEWRGSKTLRVSEKAQGFTLGLDDPEFTGLPNPNHCNSGRYKMFSSLMRECKGRLLLTGLGGDHLFWSAPEGAPLVADELRRGDLLGAHRECRIWSRASNVPYLQLLLTRAMPMAIGGSYHVLETPNWLSRGMKRDVSGRARDMVGRQPKSARPSRRAQLFALDLLFRTVSAGYFNEYSDLYVSHPYTHRPLVEFCLSTPLSQYLRAGQTRSLMRRALTRLLPARICRRLSKAGADEAYIRALQLEWSGHSDVDQWAVCERGFVDPRRLSECLTGMRFGVQRLSGHLMRLVSMERWLRSLRRVQKAPRPKTPATNLYQLRKIISAHS